MSSSKVINARIQALSDEFKSLGMENINVNVDVMEQLMESVYKLIKLYRKALKKHNELSCNEAALRETTNEKEKQIKELRATLDEKIETISKLERELTLKTEENETFKTRFGEVQKGVDLMKQLFKTRRSEFKREVKKLNEENNELRLKLGEQIGKQTSNQELSQQIMTKFKEKEYTYKEKIRRLKSDNIALMEEVIALKRESTSVEKEESINFMS